MISTDSVLTRENLGQPKWNRNFAHTILCFRRQNYSNTQKISPEIGPHRTVATWQYFVCCSTAHNIIQQVEYIHFMLKTSLISDKGPFINYVVRILVVFDSFNPALPNSLLLRLTPDFTYQCSQVNDTPHIDKRWHIWWIPPLLPFPVNVDYGGP